MYDIEEGVTPPCGRHSYPFSKMKVGDSFFAAGKSVAALGSSSNLFRKKYQKNWKFSCRTVEGGARIWRIK